MNTSTIVKENTMQKGRGYETNNEIPYNGGKLKNFGSYGGFYSHLMQGKERCAKASFRRRLMCDPLRW